MLYFEKDNLVRKRLKRFDADFEGLTSNAELYIFNQEDSQEWLGLI